jgi:hypothetical protein
MFKQNIDRDFNDLIKNICFKNVLFRSFRYKYRLIKIWKIWKNMKKFKEKFNKTKNSRNNENMKIWKYENMKIWKY